MGETGAVRTMALSRQAAVLDSLAEEAGVLTADVARCRDRLAGAAWPQARAQAFGQLEQFHRRLRSISLRRAELTGSGSLSWPLPLGEGQGEGVAALASTAPPG